MITAFNFSIKPSYLRWIQYSALFVSLITVIFFLRFHVSSLAESFAQDFERQGFVELSRGETFAVARKLAALSKASQLSCVIAKKGNLVFFEERKSQCREGIFGKKETIFEKNHDIEVAFIVNLPDDLFLGLIVFLLAQVGLIATFLYSQYEGFRIKHQHEIELGALARQVAHDIRSPLAVLKVLRSQEALTEPQVQTEKRALHRLDSLVRFLLGNGNESIKRETIDAVLGEVVEEKLAEFSHLRGLHIQNNISPQLVGRLLPGDSYLWKRTLSNLVNNAVEASTEGEIYVELSSKLDESSGKVDVIVADRGKGIPAEYLPKIGIRGGTFSKPGGVGLGLFAAREFARSLGGTLEVRSSLGKGTSVEIRIPRFQFHTMILLIDDDQSLAEVWRLAAERKGFGFEHFQNAERFLGAVKESWKEAEIFLDWQLGEESAARLGEELHRRGFRNLHICTGYSLSRREKPAWAKDIIGKEPPWL